MAAPSLGLVSAPLTTRRTRLRRLTEADRPLWVRLHTDPAQYPHAPWARSDDAGAERMFARALAHWDEHGFGYGVVEEVGTGEAVGVAGAIHGGSGGHLNLYYRLDVSRHGSGLGPELARAVAADVVEHGPALPLTATARPGHLASIRTAERAGLTLAGAAEEGAVLPGVPEGAVERARAADPPDLAASVVLVSPRVEVWRAPLDGATRERVLDLWCAVNDDGGAVGFLPGAARADVAAALALHEEQLGAGEATAVLLRAPDDAVLALGLWVRATGSLFAHTRTAYRVMTDPARRGRNLGRLLLAAMHRTAREEGVEVARLEVRSGLGLVGFYERSGYAEVGRVPGSIRVAAGDDRDTVVMARRLDERPMVSDGRP